MVLQTARKI